MNDQNLVPLFESLTVDSFNRVPSSQRFAFMKWWISAKKLNLILSGSQNTQLWQEIEDLDMLALDVGMIAALSKNGSAFAADYPNIAQREFRRTVKSAPVFHLDRPILRQACEKAFESCLLCLSLVESKVLTSELLLPIIETQVSSLNNTLDAVFCALRPTGFEEYPQDLEDQSLLLHVCGSLYSARFLRETANNANFVLFEENRKMIKELKKKFARTMPKSLRTVVDMGVIDRDKLKKLRRQYD